MSLPDRNSTNFPLAVAHRLSKTEQSDVLQYHQAVVREYFSISQNRGLLVFHGTGTGKTMLAVSIADAMKDKYNIVILSAKSLQHNFKKEVVKYANLAKTSAPEYTYISSNAGNMIDQLGRIGKSQEEIEFEKTLEIVTSSSIENSMLIVDEAQNLFNGIVNGSKNATGLYHRIMATKNIKLVFLSATPIVNSPFEIVPMYNMLHGSELLPTDYDVFTNFYIKDGITMKNRERFKNRIFGLTSYFGDWWKSGGIVERGQTIKRDHFPDQLALKIERVKMSQLQFSAYSNARDKEKAQSTRGKTIKVSLQKPSGSASSTYRVESRQISNYYLPPNAIKSKVGQYGNIKTIENLTQSQLLDLDTHSPKMKRILKNLAKHKGVNVVYSSFVSGEGLGVFARVLQAKGWSEYDGKKKTGKTFVFITGAVSAADRAERIDIFNSRANRDGGIIDLMLLSGAGAEGLDLKNVMSIHIMEPYWNYGRIEQIIARAVRYKSHDQFDTQQSVQPYIYLSDAPNTTTTDMHLFSNSIKRKRLIDRVYAAMIESSIDCKLHNKSKNINCLTCVPNNSQLFHPDIPTDLKRSNPCMKPSAKKIKAKKIIYNNQEYYIADGIYHKDNGVFVKLDRSHPDYADILKLNNM